MAKKDKNDEGNLSVSKFDSKFMVEVLAEIGHTVKKEKTRLENGKKNNESDVFKLNKDMLVKDGDRKFKPPMPRDLATLKSFIQIIVKDEIKRSQRK